MTQPPKSDEHWDAIATGLSGSIQAGAPKYPVSEWDKFWLSPEMISYVFSFIWSHLWFF